MLERAIQIAINSHSGQVDKAGKPYILHSFRVMFAGTTVDEMICGVLHDVVEDTDFTFEKLAKCDFSVEIMEAIDALTRRANEKYTDFIQRAYKNKIARNVKKYDLVDNLDKDRLGTLTEKDKIRMEKYKLALDIL